MGYKYILNLPDFQNNGYRTIKQETQAGSTRKFLPVDGFFILVYHLVISGSVPVDPGNPVNHRDAMQGINKPAERVGGYGKGIREKQDEYT
jgi:hypothetical protein